MKRILSCQFGEELVNWHEDYVRQEKIVQKQICIPRRCGCSSSGGVHGGSISVEFGGEIHLTCNVMH